MVRVRLVSVLMCAAVSVAGSGETPWAPEDAPREIRFANPPASARILPLRHGRPNDRARADAELARLKDCGFGGMASNVDFTDYLDSDANWRTYGYVVDRAHALGMSQWLYDEKGYPSGTAGGKTLDGHPEWAARAYLVAVTNVPAGSPALPPSPPGRPVATLRRPAGGGKAETVYVVTDEYILDGTHISVSVSAFKYRYPNLLMPEPTARFIELTHEAYRRRLGPSLKHVTSTFTDEPSLMTCWMKDKPYFCLPVSDELLSAYRAASGHPLADDVPELVAGAAAGEVAATRHRYWSMVGARVSENFAGQLRRWADANGILSGGHLLAEESLVGHVCLYGDFFRTLRQFSAPGCDVLTSIPHRVGWLTPLLAGSAGELNGSRRVMSEASDHCERYRAAGDTRPVYQVGEREIVGALNRQIWGGVNTFTSYYRWDAFRPGQIRRINEEIGRTVTLMAEGRSAAEIAILYPADSLQVGFEPALRWGGGSRARQTADLVQAAGSALFRGNRSFMFADAESIAGSVVAEGRLVCGPLAWRAVILPGVSTLPLAAARKLSEFRQAGGLVVALGERPVNSTQAFPDPEIGRLAQTWAMLPQSQSALLADFLKTACPAPLALSRGEPDILRTAHRRTAHGDVFFVLNDSGADWSGAVRLAGDPRVAIWNPRVGLASSAAGEIPLDLPAWGGVVLTTETRVEGLAPAGAVAFNPHLAALAGRPASIALERGAFVAGTNAARPDGWQRVDTRLTRGGVDTFAFLAYGYDAPPLRAGAPAGVGFKVRVPETTGGHAVCGIFLRTKDGTNWYARGDISLSAKGEAEVFCAFGAFARHGRGSEGTASLKAEDVVRISFGYGGYFGVEGEKVVFEVSEPHVLVF
ncbi:MAG: hypothetical protein ACI4Q3_08155 [Kiritimatiellia bacterium]